MSDEYVTALLEERAGYERRDDKIGVAAVDAELVRVGYKSAGKRRETAAVKPATETR